MKDPILPFEQCKELKELGFNYPVSKAYAIREDNSIIETPILVNDANKLGEYYFSAPTLSEAARWLREEKSITINIVACIDWSKWHTHIHVKGSETSHFVGKLPDYDIALIEGITKAIDYLKANQ